MIPTRDRAFVGAMRAVSRGFLDTEPQPWQQAYFLKCNREDQARFRCAYEPSPYRLSDDDEPVGTLITYPETLSLGSSRRLPVRCISDVIVRSTHRRRGIMRTLMTAELDDMAAAGVPAAVLTASEAGIYRRFGFGQAIPIRQIRVRTDRDFALRAPVDGSMEIVSLATYLEHLPTVFDEYHDVTMGSIGRSRGTADLLSGAVKRDTEGTDGARRHALYVSPSGEVAGAVNWEIENDDHVRVRDLVSPTAASQFAIWKLLGDIDLTSSVEYRFAPGDDPLPYALVEPDVYSVTGHRDLVWLRILDVPAALHARSYSSDGRVVIRIDDELGHAAGTYVLSVKDSTASVKQCDEAESPGVHLDVAALGSVLLGGLSVHTLTDVGVISGPDIESFARLMWTPRRPRCITPF